MLKDELAPTISMKMAFTLLLVAVFKVDANDQGPKGAIQSPKAHFFL